MSGKPFECRWNIQGEKRGGLGFALLAMAVAKPSQALRFMGYVAIEDASVHIIYIHLLLCLLFVFCSLVRVLVARTLRRRPSLLEDVLPYLGRCPALFDLRALKQSPLHIFLPISGEHAAM